MRKINIPIATPITIYEKSSSILIHSSNKKQNKTSKYKIRDTKSHCEMD
jgi:hypothetical protein